MSEALRPCPFCGARHERDQLDISTNGENGYVSCDICGAFGPDHDGRHHWNYRAYLTLSPDELRQIREALTECADDLAAYVEHEYPERFRDAVPSEDRRYKRDIEPVNRARAALAILASKEPKA